MYIPKFLIVALLLPCATVAQERREQVSVPADLMRELINEIRALRVQFAESNSLHLRIIVMTEKLRAETDMAFRVTQDLDTVRSDIEIVANEEHRAVEQFQTVQAQYSTSSSDADRATAANDLKQAQDNVTQLKQRELTLRERESRLLSSFHEEQAKLAGITQQLLNVEAAAGNLLTKR